MTSLVLIKHHGALHPADDAASSALRSLSDGQEVLIDIKAKRNVQRHRLMWKLASILAENTEFFPSSECAMDAVKIGTGHCEMWINPTDGVVNMRPKSIAFHRMDEIEFADFLSRAITLICGRWLIGLEHAELLAKVNEVLDGASVRRAA